MKEVGVGPEKDSIQVTVGGMIEAVIDPDHIQEQIPIEIELDVSSGRNTIILVKISKYVRNRKRPDTADATDA